MTSKGRILAVDDTPDSLRLLTDLLKAEGYEVRAAISGELALHAAVLTPPELILLDIRMPVMDGYEVCRRLKADPTTREVPVIFVSAASETAEKVEGFTVGAVDYVTKPYQRDELLARVNTHLELNRLRSHLESLVDERTSKLKQSEERLQLLNKTLEERVVEKTQQNIEQERLLIEQSRSAMMGEMIRNIAHQWRQPLSTVGLVVQNILLDSRENRLIEENLEKDVDTAMRCINSMSKTIDDFRNFFRTDKTNGLFNLQQAINESLNLMEATLKNNDIQVLLNGDLKLQAFGLVSEFSQVILNLLSNAADALAVHKVQHGRIELELSSTEHSGIVVIRDNAGGIPEEAMGRIFDPYYSTKAGGSGIGLYMSKVIIEKHMGGSIACRNVGKGAEFTVSIPLRSSESV